MGAVRTHVVEEPQPVPLDGSAQREVRVPVLDEARRFRNPGAPQPIVEVARLRPCAGRTGECRTTEVVATRFRNDVEGWSAAVGLPHSAGDGHLQLLCVREIVGKTRDAAAVERRPDVHAVDLDRSLVAASPPRREEEIDRRSGHRHRRIHVEGHRLNAGHHGQDVAVCARCGNGREDRIRKHDLSFRARLHVDDWRLAGDGDRFSHGPDAQVRVDRRHAGSRQLDALVPDCRKPRQPERHGVGSRREVDDPVLAGPVGHDTSRFLDEHGTRRFHSYARQDAARRILHDARQCGLGECWRREKKYRCKNGRRRRQCTHKTPSSLCVGQLSVGSVSIGG